MSNPDPTKATHDEPLIAGASTIDGPLREGPGSQIGPYKLLRLIGEGGFGSVFLAEQEQPVRRQVALKIIKLGMDTRQVVARFEAERQALALMDHPHIARVLDAGATETGRPYFVMELCTGESITGYCDRHKLEISARMELFVQVCQAVQHAHQKAIIHRDIKPSNILVSSRDGRPHAKVIDFGIAKATANRLTEKTLFTEQGQFIGTPEYMSPEQAEGSLDIDTRTDVYSLGVLLYELLTGVTPFDSQTLRCAAYAEILRIIREVEPPQPSTRLSRTTPAVASVAAHRHIEPWKLGRALRGELDWIVMKALEKDRTRRYESANGLALDVKRYLSGEAVIAAPASRLYRLRKFARQNKGPVAGGILIAAALAVGLVGTTWQAREATRQAARADARADELQRVSEFQTSMLAQVDPTEAGKRLSAGVMKRFGEALDTAGVTASERSEQVRLFASSWERVNATDTARDLIEDTILRPAAQAIEKQFQDQEAVGAALRQALASQYQDFGLYDAARPLQESALATRRRVLGEEHSDTLASIQNTGYFLEVLGKLTEAEGYFREALEKRRRVLGEEHPDTLVTISHLAYVLQAQGRLAEAEPYWIEALEKRRRVLGEEHPQTLTSIGNMGGLRHAQGRLAESVQYWRDALEKSARVLGRDDPVTIVAIANMAFVLQAQDKLDEAEPYWLEALERRSRVLGEDHPRTITTISRLGSLRHAQGRLPEAELYYREALEKRRRVLGDEHPDTLVSVNNLGLLLLDQGKSTEAEPLVHEAFGECRRVLGSNDETTLVSVTNMGRLLRSNGKLAESVETLSSAETIDRAGFTGFNALPLATFLVTLGCTRAEVGYDAERFSAAEANLLEAHRIRLSCRGEKHNDTRECVQALIRLYATWNVASPGQGFDAKAEAWKIKLDAAATSTTSTGKP